VLCGGAVRADIWVAPLPQGSDATGDGSEGNPYNTISFAYSRATVPGETIRVKPGQIFDVVYALDFIEVSPGVFVDKWVDIIAESSDPTQTEIIGDFFNPVISVGGSGGSLQGFTLIGGGQSGVVGVGSVSIINNIIDGHVGEFGGGLRIESDTCTYGPSVVQVIGNSLSNNQASADGGGMWLAAGVDAENCQVHPVSVLIEGNTFVGNTANDDGGGLQAETNTFPNIQFADITVRDNTFSGNTAVDEGGGARVEALGQGTETIIISGNTFDLNVTSDDGGGLTGRVEPINFANHHMLIDGNTLTNNTSGDGGGMAAFLAVDDLAQNQHYGVVVSNNVIDHNITTGSGRGGGGILARFIANDTTSSNSEFRIVGNTISYNESPLMGGGLAAHILTNRLAGDCQVPAFPAAGHIDVVNNLIVRNDTFFTGAVGAGAGVSLRSCLSSTASVDFKLNTIARNRTHSGGSAIHLDFLTDAQASNEFSLSHSILWYNQGGDDLDGVVPTGNYVVSVEYSDVDRYGNWIGDRTGIRGNISTNPDFVDDLGDDFRLLGTSPAIEAGSRSLGTAPPTDWEGSPRVVDSDSDGLFVVDMGADEFFVCTDADLDGFGSPVSGGDDCELDNCPDDYNPGQSDCDVDTVGDVCDLDTVDADGDGVDAACDLDDGDPTVCGDLDADLCDDCVSGVAYPAADGADFDFDGACDLGDEDDDSDGALDSQDQFPLDPTRCGDADGDSCGDDCSGGFYDPLNDGPDFDGDTLCDAGDPDDDNDGVVDEEDSDPLNPTVCMDSDFDTCDDCTGGVFDPFNDGPDGDGDGRCTPGDSDDTDPLACADDDSDTCDDCSSGVYDPSNDGPDFDGDTLCDAGDPDDDNDGVADDDDCAPLTTGVSSPVGDVGPTLRLGPSKLDLSWIDIHSSHVFNVYRGRTTAGPFLYNHGCHVAETPGTDTTDVPEIPPEGFAFFYLVSGKNTCGEGTLGHASSGTERPNDDPCPLLNEDTDSDGILDIDDNCVRGANPSQTDTDFDTVGDACDNCPFDDNVTQEDFDSDGDGDACDLCTDTDGDGRGDPGFPNNTCPEDNCPDIPNSGQFDGDGDGLGNPCDACPLDPGNDDDEDGVCFADDNCPDQPNPTQSDVDGDGDGDACDLCTDTDGDDLADPGYPASTCPLDNCPSAFNPGQDDFDGDGDGDLCDACTDTDGDLYGDPGFPLNICPEDNCPTMPNPFQRDTDGDGDGDLCDPCFANPDPGCVACPPGIDPDGDGICQPSFVFVEEGTGADYLANVSDPGIDGLEWVATDYVVGPPWQSGVYGFGYETTPGLPNANNLISTPVPAGSMSIYTRTSFDVVVDPVTATRVELGADFDDGVVAWINGAEVFRSPQMPAGDPAWDTAADPRESSNGPSPVYEPLMDITDAARPQLQVGTNVFAIGVWNTDPGSSDLVLVPRLSMVTQDNCPEVANAAQEDTDGDDRGDVCDECTDTDGDGCGDPGFPANTCCEDNCPDDPNPGQEDFDEDGAGDICDPCPTDPNDADPDMDGICSVDDNCPDDANPNQEDGDLDGVGNVCDNCPDDANPGQEDFDADGAGDICDTCTDQDGDTYGDPGFPLNICPEDNCPTIPNDQTDSDGDGPGDECDPCFANPDPGCVACPAGSDSDGDGVCQPEFVPVEEGVGTDYLANTSDPGIVGLEWVAEDYVLGPGWQAGIYGVGYETGPPPNAQDLITTPVPVGTRSVYTRVSFQVEAAADVTRFLAGADWDDGFIIWLNGVELVRSAEMPAGDPAWNDPLLGGHESSNQSDPVYTLTDVTAAAQAALHDGTNVAAIGVWNGSSGSSDLVLVPWLSYLTTELDNCPDVSNPGQEDTDGDGIGDACEPTIAIAKTADDLIATNGQTVTYGYAVTNPGNDVLSNVGVTDDKCAPVTAVESATSG
jgi:hypothetical protein